MEPITLAVIHEQLERLATSAPENKQGAGHGIGTQRRATHGGQAIDALSEIHWLHCQQDPHLGGDLDHGSRFQKASARATTAEVLWPNPIVMRTP
jgi:hypothetical protein